MQKPLNPVPILEKYPFSSQTSSQNPAKFDHAKIFNGFYKKTFKERLNQLNRMDPDLAIEHFETGGLSLSRAELMVENCIGKVSIPLGLG